MIRRGYTLVELLVSLIVFGVVMAALFVTFITMWKNQNTATNQSIAQVGAEQASYVLASAIQTSALCGASDSGCVSNASLQNVSTTGCTVYSRNSSGTLVQTVFASSGGNFTMTVGSTTTTLATNATVTLTYYQSTTYNATSLSSFTPTNSTVANVIAVQISITDTQSTASTGYTTLVRLPNGP